MSMKEKGIYVVLLTELEYNYKMYKYGFIIFEDPSALRRT